MLFAALNGWASHGLPAPVAPRPVRVGLEDSVYLEQGVLAPSNAALVTRGVNLLREALALAPHAPAPLLYYAIIAYQTPGNTALAR